MDIAACLQKVEVCSVVERDVRPRINSVVVFFLQDGDSRVTFGNAPETPRAFACGFGATVTLKGLSVRIFVIVDICLTNSSEIKLP